jgi:predicted dehydrogenase
MAAAAAAAPLGVGILGAAWIAAKNIRAITKFAPAAAVVALGARDRARAAAALAAWGLEDSAAAYGSYEEVIDDPRVEAVYIALPAALHLKWVLRAAAAGKHVLVEKPVAVDEAELAAMLAACAAAGVVFMDGTMWVHHRRTARLEALRRGGALGELRAVDAVFSFNLLGRADAADNVRLQAGCDPLGAVGDLLWYCARAALWAFDYESPTAVAAHPGAAFTADGVPTRLGATLLFAGGRCATLECAFDRALTQRLELFGTEGTLRVDDFVISAAEASADYSLTSQHAFAEYDTRDVTRREAAAVAAPVPQEAAMWVAFAAAARAASAGALEAQWAARAAQTQRVLFAVLESARDGCRLVEFKG